MFKLLAGLVAVGLVALIGFVLVCILVRLVVGLVLLPFKIALGVLGGLLKLGLCLLLCGLLGVFVLGGLVLLPLLPLLLLAGIVWLVVSLLRPSPV